MNRLDEGPLLPKHVIDWWRNPLIIADWQSGFSIRDVAKKHGVNRDKVHKIVKHLRRKP